VVLLEGPAAIKVIASVKCSTRMEISGGAEWKEDFGFNTLPGMQARAA
jgi:hypothetical protein